MFDRLISWQRRWMEARRRTARNWATGALALWGTVGQGCGNHSHSTGGVPTEAICPPTSSLTYTNFGKTFVDQYCQRCHASTVAVAARNGAPDDHVFDDVLDIRPLSGHMDELAGAGPAATNTAMPPSDPKPTEAQRRQLSEWLACGAP